jgi:hypothetical protein
MNDDFLYGLRQDPPPELAQRLKARLRQADASAHRSPPRLARWLALAASVAVVATSFTFPPVRAGAQAFLDLFRLSNFAGVSFDPQRLSEIAATGLDFPHLFGEEIEMVTPPAPPVSYASPQEAGAAAGIRVYTPAWLPAGMALSQTDLIGETALRFTFSTANLQTLLEALGIDDVTVPAGIHGQQASVRVPPIVRTTYTDGKLRASLTQARSPDVSFPAGLDLPVLAEIALRILGLDRREAYRIAQSVDWRTTLLVPVPATAATFQEVNVQGQQALLIESIAPRGDGDQRRERQPVGQLLLWSSQGNVYALDGTLRPAQLLEMAQTLQ